MERAGHVTEIEKITTKKLALFTGRTHPQLAQDIADHLGMELGQVNMVEFANGELKPRYAESVRGSDVFILQSHYGIDGHSVNDSIMGNMMPLERFPLCAIARISPPVFSA